jgi:hypothetical protein
MDHVENTISNSSSVVTCISLAMIMCLLSYYLAADNFFWLNYSGLSAAMSQYEKFRVLKPTLKNTLG